MALYTVIGEYDVFFAQNRELKAVSYTHLRAHET